MKRALIAIDVQESFRARPLWERIANPDIAEPVNRLVRLARDNGDLVVWVLHTEPGSGDVFDPALGHVRLLDELEQPLSGEPVLHKTSHNAFTTTDLQRRLTEAGVGELWVCGIRTEQCVETTARLGSDLGVWVRATGRPGTTGLLEGRPHPTGELSSLNSSLRSRPQAAPQAPSAVQVSKRAVLLAYSGSPSGQRPPLVEGFC
ncbi:cysteine hydrolase family protein [Streptomyces sp. NPDC088760]|uniref:cysteine hydrolase family protein n=1 Tax=Streptomyces sp. NPDC088760 TaxID=3365890 RepID=UPI00381876D8